MTELLDEQGVHILGICLYIHKTKCNTVDS